MLQNKEEILFDYIKDVENLMDRRFQGTRFKDKLIFLVVDEFAGIKNFYDKRMKSMIV